MIALLGAFSQETAGLRRQMAVEEVVASLFAGCTAPVWQETLYPRSNGDRQAAAEKATQFSWSVSLSGTDLYWLCRSSDSGSEIGDVVVCSTCAARPDSGRSRGSRKRMRRCQPAALAAGGPGDGSKRFLAGTCVTTPGVVSGARQSRVEP